MPFKINLYAFTCRWRILRITRDRILATHIHTYWVENGIKWHRIRADQSGRFTHFPYITRGNTTRSHREGKPTCEFRDLRGQTRLQIIIAGLETSPVVNVNPERDVLNCLNTITVYWVRRAFGTKLPKAPRIIYDVDYVKTFINANGEIPFWYISHP